MHDIPLHINASKSYTTICPQNTSAQLISLSFELHELSQRNIAICMWQGNNDRYNFHHNVANSGVSHKLLPTGLTAFVRTRAFSRQFFTQKFWVKSESTLIFLSKNLSFGRIITTNFDSQQKYPFGTNIEFYRKCIYFQLMPTQWHELSIIMVKMWYFVGFQPSKCRNTHIQPQMWSFWPIFPNNSESLPKVCYINWKRLRNSQ